MAQATALEIQIIAALATAEIAAPATEIVSDDSDLFADIMAEADDACDMSSFL
ncbi:hypothetical protein ACOI1H_14755 [Loktanella sp. DJP18]|uniref:hypothetical protein n=1 Tax=Loktanella sp. DJP18 TaxID=3409788 RepID=UPI003BB4B16A